MRKLRTWFTPLINLTLGPLSWWSAPLAFAAAIFMMVALSYLPLNPYLNQNVQFIGFIGLATLLPILLSGNELQTSDVGVWPQRGHWSRAIAATIIGVIVLWVTAMIFETGSERVAKSSVEVIKAFGFGKSTLHDVALVVITAILGPIGEEALYRGLIFRGLYDGSRNLLKRHEISWLPDAVPFILALVLSGIIFANAHGGDGQDEQWAALAVHGIIYGLIFAVSGNLLSAVMAHSINNVMAVTSAIVAAGTVQLAPAAWVMLVIAPAITLLLMWLWFRLVDRLAAGRVAGAGIAGRQDNPSA